MSAPARSSGIAGLVGSGRSNVAETLFGVTPAHSGTIELFGKEVRIDSPAVAMRHGMAFLTEDRKETGCFLLLDIQENTQIAVLQSGYVKNGFVTQKQAQPRFAVEVGQTLRVKTPDMHEPIINLSGGNQQKVLIARWLLTKPRILILDEPTRGIDVGAKAEIHRLISKLAGEGVAVIMISSEMPEVLGHERPHHGDARRPGDRLPGPRRSQPGQDHGAGVTLNDGRESGREPQWLPTPQYLQASWEPRSGCRRKCQSWRC